MTCIYPHGHVSKVFIIWASLYDPHIVAKPFVQFWQRSFYMVNICVKYFKFGSEVV